MCLDVISDKCFSKRQVRDKKLNAKGRGKNRTRYEIENKDEKIVSHLSFDLCNESGCDYLFIIEEKGSDKYIFVELKDSDLIQAIGQIRVTMERYRSCLTDKEIHARVVLTKTYSPDVSDKRVLNFRREIIRHKGSFEHRSNYFKDTV